MAFIFLFLLLLLLLFVPLSRLSAVSMSAGEEIRRAEKRELRTVFNLTNVLVHFNLVVFRQQKKVLENINKGEIKRFYSTFSFGKGLFLSL